MQEYCKNCVSKCKKELYLKVLLKSGPQWTPLESLTLNAIATMLRLALNGTAHTCNENSAISVDTCFASPLRFTQRRASARLARTTQKWFSPYRQQ